MIRKTDFKREAVAMSERFHDRINDTDGFWDIDDMLPEKKQGKRFSYDTDTVEISLGEHAEQLTQPIPRRDTRDRKEDITGELKTSALEIARKALADAEIKIKTASALASGDRKTKQGRERLVRSMAAEKTAPESEITSNEYTPEGNPLIKKVTVKPWQARYSFYERFHADARRLFPKKGEPCSHVPFFSYTPQYSQLSDEQLKFYLYWRECVRQGEYLFCDYAYILLFIYEIINLPDLIPAREGAELLCKIWRAYRKNYPKLDRIISEWLCDYCLIGQIAPPTEQFFDFYEPTPSGIFLREYYTGYDKSVSDPYAAVLFACASDYNYRRSKFITPENKELFDKHIKGAFLYAFDKLEKSSKGAFYPIGEKTAVFATARRDAYSGAVCAYNVKRSIEIEYISCSRSVELRFAVTDMIKCAENGVRAMLGIRSRFHTPGLPMPLRNAAEEYFAPHKKKAREESPKQKPKPEYEKLYEAERTELSLDYAKELEEKAWATTNLLVGDEAEGDDGAEPFTEPTESAEKPRRVAVPEKNAEAHTEESARLFVSALDAVMIGDSHTFSELAKSKNLLPDTLAEQINDMFFDELSDTVLYDAGDGFRLVPDYTEEVTEWIKRQKN